MKPEPPICAREIIMADGMTIFAQIHLCYCCLRETVTIPTGNFLIRQCVNKECKQYAMPFASWPEKEASH